MQCLLDSPIFHVLQRFCYYMSFKKNQQKQHMPSPLLLLCTKESLKIDGQYKNNVITRNIALTEGTEKTI